MAEHRGYQGSETILYDTVKLDTCHFYLSKPTGYVTPLNPNGNCGL